MAVAPTVGSPAESWIVEVDAHLAGNRRKEAATVAEQALAAFREAGDQAGQARALSKLGSARLRLRRFAEAAVAYAEAVDLCLRLGDNAGQADAQVGLAAAEHGQGNFAAALAAAQAAIVLSSETPAGGAVIASAACDVASEACIALGRPEEAARLAKECLVTQRRARNCDGMAVAEQTLIRVCLRGGDAVGALRAAKKACSRMCEVGDGLGHASMLRVAAELHLRAGRAELAGQAAEEALAILRDQAPQKAGDNEVGDRPELNRIVAEASIAHGERPPSVASRAGALAALARLREALEARADGAFLSARRSFQASGAGTQQDLDLVLGPLTQNDPMAAVFVQSHMPASALLADLAAQGRPFCLRRFHAEPARGVSGKLTWEQTMGAVTITFPLVSDGYKDGSVDVQMSTYHLQVSLQGKKLAPLSGVLSGVVVFGKSWWEVREEESKLRVRGVDTSTKKRTLVIHLTKLEHKAWLQLWHSEKGELAHPLARGRFSWTAEMHEDVQEDQKALSALAPLRCGICDGDGKGDATRVGARSGVADHFVFSPDDLCVGIHASQTENALVIGIHFDGEALRVAQERTGLEDLLAADVWEDQLCIFLRGDELNPILWARLAGRVCPEDSAWCVTTSDRFRSRQRECGAPAPVLEVRLTKSSASQGRWQAMFSDCWQHRLMLSNYGELEELRWLFDSDAAARQALAARAARGEVITFDISDEAEGAPDEPREAELAAAVLTDDQRDEVHRRLHAWREERFEGLPGARLIQRSDMGLQEQGFASYVSTVVSEITQRIGCSGKARWSTALGRYSYIH